MTHSRISAVCLCATLVFLIAAGSPLQGQQALPTNNAVVPTLVQFSGVLTNSNSKPLTDITGVTFSLYAEQADGAPLWMETQNVQPDASGHYAVMLGSSTSQGLPSDIFAAGGARWLGGQAEGQEEQPRVMLLSVPYALKAGDAATLGGKPASAYALAESAGGAAAGTTVSSASPTVTGKTASKSAKPPLTNCSVTSDGAAGVNTLARFTTPCNVQGSAISESSGNVGIGGTSSLAKFYLSDSETNFGTRWLQRNVFNTSATKNGTNESLGFDLDQSNMTIPAGVTDNGYRLAVRGVAYAATTGFAGTLAQQLGMVGEAGILQAKSGAKIGTAIGGEFEVLNRTAGTTITNGYGVYIYNADTTGTITHRYDLYASSHIANILSEWVQMLVSFVVDQLQLAERWKTNANGIVNLDSAVFRAYMLWSERPRARPRRAQSVGGPDIWHII